VLKQIELEKVVVENDQNHVNIRELFEKLGCAIEWKDNTVFITLK
jgi:hypothetical protein